MMANVWVNILVLTCLTVIHLGKAVDFVHEYDNAQFQTYGQNYDRTSGVLYGNSEEDDYDGHDGLFSRDDIADIYDFTDDEEWDEQYGLQKKLKNRYSEYSPRNPHMRRRPMRPSYGRPKRPQDEYNRRKKMSSPRRPSLYGGPSTASRPPPLGPVNRNSYGNPNRRPTQSNVANLQQTTDQGNRGSLNQNTRQTNDADLNQDVTQTNQANFNQNVRQSNEANFNQNLPAYNSNNPLNTGSRPGVPGTGNRLPNRSTPRPGSALANNAASRGTSNNQDRQTPVSFGYDFTDERGNQQFREENSDGLGRITGRYGFHMADGVGPAAPADVTVRVDDPPNRGSDRLPTAATFSRASKTASPVNFNSQARRPGGGLRIQGSSTNTRRLYYT